jgi:hypothetical protein
MARVTRRHKIVRILFLIAAAIAWMGPPRPPAPPGCWFPRPPRPPMLFHQVPPASPDATH